MIQDNIENLRNDYTELGIDPEALPDNPFDFFKAWFSHAVEAGIPEPNAMVIATADSLDDLNQRTVLMKSFDENGFYFYTNYRSRKARQLARNAHISCLFPWLALHRQVAISGNVRRSSKENTERYFKTRPRSSQVGAWASKQSEKLDKRETLEKRVSEVEARFAGSDVPVPEFWGGYHVTPIRFEFWQGRNSRLHDRYVYTRTSEEAENWTLESLYP